MSTDGSGKPDLPVTARVEELECLSCVTPIGNVSLSNTYNTYMFNTKNMFRPTPPTAASMLKPPVE